jgi:hypothetical protein
MDRLCDAKFGPNSRLGELVHDIDFSHDSFVMKFIALGSIVGQARTQTQAAPDERDEIQERMDFQFLDENQLTDELRNALALNSGIPGECTIYAAGKRSRRSALIQLEDAEYPSCVMVVEAEQLVQLYKQHRDSLFTLNIRNYLGNTATNKLLSQTLSEEPENFYYYNNGIACLAERLEIESDHIKAKGLQIINGAQTVRSLAKAATKSGKSSRVENIKVLVRITQAERQYGQTGRFRDSIVRYNNTQNTIKLSDFRSNDPIHADLKRRFAEHRWQSKEVIYVSKRTDPQVHRGRHVIPLEEFAKSVYSFFVDPIAFSSRTSFLFDDGDRGGYKDVFGDGKDVWVTMPDDEFRARAAIWWLAVTYSEQLRSDKAAATDNLDKAALERKWIPLYVTRLVLQRTYGSASIKQELARISKGNWQFGRDSVGKWVADLYRVTKDVVLYSYREAARKPGFVHRNWTRDPETVESLRHFAATAPITLVPYAK